MHFSVCPVIKWTVSQTLGLDLDLQQIWKDNKRETVCRSLTMPTVNVLNHDGTLLQLQPSIDTLLSAKLHTEFWLTSFSTFSIFSSKILKIQCYVQFAYMPFLIYLFVTYCHRTAFVSGDWQFLGVLSRLYCRSYFYVLFSLNILQLSISGKNTTKTKYHAYIESTCDQHGLLMRLALVFPWGRVCKFIVSLLFLLLKLLIVYFFILCVCALVFCLHIGRISHSPCWP